MYMRNAIAILTLSAAVLLGACGSGSTGGPTAASETETGTLTETTAQEMSQTEDKETETAESNADGADAAAEPARMDFPNSGVSLPLPVSAKLHEDSIYLFQTDQELNKGLYLASVVVYPASEEELMAVTDQAKMAEISAQAMDLYTILAIDGNRDEKELRELLSQMGVSTYTLTRAGEAGEYHYFWIDFEGSGQPAPGPMQSVFREMREESLGLRELAEFRLPKAAAMNGVSLSFKTEDLSGNPVDSAELFTEHELTMVNIWASWCGPCIRELPEIQKLQEEYADRGLAVVGILYDGREEAGLADGLDILKSSGAEYLNLQLPETIPDAFEVSAFPTTLFVDREGRIVGTPVVGADPAEYRNRIEKLLAS